MGDVRQVFVVAKAPAKGWSKTRLTPPLSADEAARLADAMLRDTLEGCRAEADRLGILCPSQDDARTLRAYVAPDEPVVVQHGSGLADALREAVRAATPDGPVALVSSDIPGVPAGQVRAAFAALDGNDIVLGPSFDGGYWLIAMRTFHEAPFTAIPWSTPACLSVTQQRAREAGLRVHLLAPWIDIDTGVDLSYAVHEPPGLVAGRSASLLDEIAATHAVPVPPQHRLARSTLVTASPWRSLIDDELASPTGAAARYAYLAVPRAVFVVAVTRDRHVLLVRQYRHPVRDWTLEVPAGTVEDGESAAAAAAREASEEVGATGGTWRHLGSFYSSSAHLSLRSDGFLVTDVDVGAPHPDAGEELFVVRRPVAEVLATARAGGFVEGQTALCLLLAAPFLE